MHWIDWIIVLIPLLFVLIIGFKTRKYVKGVADFLTAGRVAGRYVVAVASGEAAMGIISLVAVFERYYQCGFAISFWGQINIPILILLSLSGYCVYRFRETRAMTLGQFFELRYNKSFRILAASIQAISGIINYAIFPAVSARFLIYYLDLPVTVNIFDIQFPMFGLIMMCFLSLAVVIVCFGGQVTIMVTDCIQGILSYPMYVLVVGFIIWKFSWFSEISPTLLDRGDGLSMLNPYDVEKMRDFNLFFVFVGICGFIINRMSWSGSQGYNAAAANPHEQKMGGVLGTWRSGLSIMMYIMLAIAAYTFMNNFNYKNDATQVRQELALKVMADVAPEENLKTVRMQAEKLLAKKVTVINSYTADKYSPGRRGDEVKELTRNVLNRSDRGKGQVFATIYGQMLVPVAVREILPIGITGVFCAIMFFLLLSTDTTYMHSWGSIIVQDIILPFRKKAFTPKQQLFLLRIIIAGVAIFAFCFSLFFSQIDYILMFFSITGAIWLGGAGPCIVLGLYWNRGTSWGAFAGLLSGASIAVSGFVAQNYWVEYIYPWLVQEQLIDTVVWIIEGISRPFNPYILWEVNGDKFPINSMEIYFIAMIVSISLYISISLLTCKKVFNMDRLLHRGKYKKEEIEPAVHSKSKISWFKRNLLGIDSEYTRGDKTLAWSVFLYSIVFQFGSFIVIIVWNLFAPWSDKWWGNWFLINNLIIVGIIGVVTTVWFTIGGTLDLIKMFKRLEEKQENLLDDGRVVNHVSTDDIA